MGIYKNVENEKRRGLRRGYEGIVKNVIENLGKNFILEIIIYRFLRREMV